MTDCEIDNNDTKLMQLSNDLNSYCVNESINSDNTDLVDLNNKCLNGGFNSDHIDIGDLNNKCLNESILNCDKTNFEFSNLNNKCLSKSVNSDNTDFSDLNNNCFNESIYSDNTDFGECSNESVNSDNTDPDLNKCLKNDSKADMFNILALNCCGLKNKLQYPEFQELLSANDIICLVESKTDDTDEILLPGYIFKMKNRKTFACRKSGGIVLGYREKFEGDIEVIETENKFVLWCKISSKLMKLNSDLLLGIVYIPPEYSRYSSPDAFSQIENEYLEFTEKFKNICLIGDFNARTAEDDEFITLDENTLFETFDGFIENAPNVLQQLNLPLKRNNVDKGKNPYGNLLLNLFRGNDLFIVNGRICDNKEGNLTCRNASVVDYTICSSEFLKNIVNMSILDFSRLFSDVHSPFRVSINPSQPIREEKTDSTNNQSFKNLQNIKKWNPLKAQEFIESISVNNFNDLSEKLNNINPEEINQDFINTCTSDLCHLFISAAKNTFGTRSVYKGKQNIVKGDKPWFNLDCKFARQNYRKLKRKKKIYPWQITSEEVNNAEKHYKTLDSNLKKTPEGNV